MRPPRTPAGRLALFWVIILFAVACGALVVWWKTGASS